MKKYFTLFVPSSRSISDFASAVSAFVLQTTTLMFGREFLVFDVWPYCCFLRA